MNETNDELELLIKQTRSEDKKLKIPKSQLQAYIQSVETRLEVLKQEIRVRAKFYLDYEYDEDADFVDTLKQLKALLQTRATRKQKLSGDLVTYNMLQNDKYKQLNMLKQVLDYIKKASN